MPTISSLDHILPSETIEEILDTELGNETTAVIKAINLTPPDNQCDYNDTSSANIASVATVLPEPNRYNFTKKTNPSKALIYDPFLYPIINNNGSVNTNNLHEFQTSILNNYLLTFFTIMRQAIYHLDSGANVHTSNNCNDFTTFYPIKSDIQLAVGSTTQCQGIGAIITQLNPHTNPILLAPVYYCPNAKVNTLSPSAVKIYNSFFDVTIKVHTSLQFRVNKTTSTHTCIVTVHNNLEYISLPVYHLSQIATQQPMMASLFQNGINEQYVHQKFDH